MLHFYSNVDPVQADILLDNTLSATDLSYYGLVAVEDKKGIYRLLDDLGTLIFIRNDNMPGQTSCLSEVYKKFSKAYPNCGIISAKLNTFFREAASQLMPTDYLPLKNCSQLPPKFFDRAEVKVPCNNVIPFDLGCYSLHEPDGPNEKGWHWALMSGIKGYQTGEQLSQPSVVPFKRNNPVALKDYFKSFAKTKGLANYLLGCSLLLHLMNRKIALKKGIDRPFQRIKFGVFPKGLPIYGSKHLNRWGKSAYSYKVAALFGDLCRDAGFDREAWKKIDGFDVDPFAEFAWKNWRSGEIRQIGYYGTPHDGAYRLLKDTYLGQDLIRAGYVARGGLFLSEYLCSAYAKKGTDNGDNISSDVLHELGRRHWRLLEMLTS